MNLTIHKEPFPHVKEKEILSQLSATEKEIYTAFMLGKTYCRDEHNSVGIYAHDYHSFVF